MMRQDLYTWLKRSFDRGIPGEDAHLEMMPIGRTPSSTALKTALNVKESAVGVYLFEEKSNYKGILIQRPSYSGTHSGQISFPGGKKEATDRDLLETARRESFEEVGIPVEKGLFIGQLTNVYIPVSNYLVVPHLFYLEEKIPLIKDYKEVDEIVIYDLNQLLEVKKIPHISVELANGFHAKVPCFELADKKVWGATAIILNELRYLLR